MNWASGEFWRGWMIHRSEGYRCDVEYRSGTMPQITSMNEKGTPDIASEMWANAAAVAIDAAVKENVWSNLTHHQLRCRWGWMMSAAAAQAHPELKTIDDIIARPDLFPHPEDPSKGGLHTCPSGWGCQLSTNNLFRAFDMEAKGCLLIRAQVLVWMVQSRKRASVARTGSVLLGANNTCWQVQLEACGLQFRFNEALDNCIVKPVEECDSPKRSTWTN